MHTTNFLSSRNVRMHGMQTSKWTTKDKITQYKGLVNLYTRDKQISLVDNAVSQKRQYKALVTMRKVIEKDRHELDNAIAGDRQALHNSLSAHKEMQLAFHNYSPKKCIEEVGQLIFTKRKMLDKLKYLMDQKSQELVDLKLEEALLEDRLRYPTLGQIKQEAVAQIITGKVQDALLRKEAALAIQHSYERIIAIMKKDSLYFNSVLNSVELDFYRQCECILNATRQGQLATEYKNDREVEFEELQNAIISDMKTQKQDLVTVQEQIEHSQAKFKHLLRRDSDLTLCTLKIEQDEADRIAELQNDMNKIQDTLSFLGNSTFSTSFEMIYPNLQEQARQNARLMELSNKCQRNRDIIMNKLNHAELMSNVLDNTMVETTGEYKKRKKEVLDAIDEQIRSKEALNDSIAFKRKVIAKVRLSLRQIQQIVRPIKKEGEKKERPRRGKSATGEDLPEEADPDEIDGLKIIQTLTGTLSYLVANAHETFDSTKMNEAFVYFELLMRDRIVINEEENMKQEESILEGLVTEVSHVLTREDVKRISDEIVAANSVDEDLAALLQMKKMGPKKRKFKP